MPRTIPSNLISVVESAENAPVELFEVYLDSGTLYFAFSDNALTFDTGEGAGPQTYEPLGVRRSAMESTVDEKVDQVVIGLDDVSRALKQQIASQNFLDRRLRVLRVFREDLSAGSFITLFDGRMDMPTVTGKWFTLNVRSRLDLVNRRFPARVYATQCNYEHYDQWCTLDKNDSANKVSGTVASGSTRKTIVAPALTQADGYWRIGHLVFTSGPNAGIGRVVLSSDQAGTSVRIKVPLPNDPVVGDGFDIVRGCDRTPSDCITRFNNFVNFGGFDRIPNPNILIAPPSMGGGGGKKGGGGKGGGK